MNDTIVLFGKPGAGKGSRLREFLEGKEDLYEVISVGTLLRKAINEQSELGKEAEFYMNSGKLVPDEIINKIVIAGIKSATKNVFLDGYPRTIGQAKSMIEAGIIPNKVINFDVDDELVFFRARTRLVCEDCGDTFTTHDFRPPKVKGICDTCGGKLGRRKDDQEEVVKQRIETYNSQTHPVLDLFKSHGVQIFTIDNSDPIPARKKFAELFA